MLMTRGFKVTAHKEKRFMGCRRQRSEFQGLRGSLFGCDFRQLARSGLEAIKELHFIDGQRAV
ncbi:hypothetical protein, partial [Schlesneria sp.]|uniref:hypothetical protein n=1 Tax=Schlesneria sp. TaxID=2762018 RepID=UPI002F2178E4